MPEDTKKDKKEKTLSLKTNTNLLKVQSAPEVEVDQEFQQL